MQKSPDPIRFYLDSAKLEHVAPHLQGGLAAGVTSNPSILERDGYGRAQRNDLFNAFVAAGAQTVMMQAIGRTREALSRDASDLAGYGREIVVKLPATRAGFEVAADLTSTVSVLVTAVYSLAQASVATSLGVRFITPYAGRLSDSGADYRSAIERMHRVTEGSSSKLLVASIRSREMAEDILDIGVRHLTMNTPTFEDLLFDARTDRAVDEFESAR